MFHRLTQTEDYWLKDFAINSDDLEHIHNLLLEEESPLPIQDITMALMRRRTEQEETKLHRLLSKGTIYKPSEEYSVGDTLVFPALNFSVATVTGTRPGASPEYGDFTVLVVESARSGRQREFASGLQKPHPLTVETEVLLQPDQSLVSVEELYKLYGNSVQAKLESALDGQSVLVELFGLWFLKALLTEVGPGYLNIAEAVLDISGGGPLPPQELLQQLDLPDESRPELLEFSLNYALYKDERFDEVGPAGEVLWYLRRLEPTDVLAPPKRLAYTPISYDRNLLNLNLRKLENELDDEWSMGWEPSTQPGEATYTLTYPHWRHGTIPLTSDIAPLFPTSYQAPQIRCVIIDSHTGKEIEAWVVWESRFVYGLSAWYQENQLPIGTYLHLRPGEKAGTAVIRFDEHRPQREWIRVAQVTNGQLVFGMQKRAVGCSYDDMMLIGLDDPAATDHVWVKIVEQGWSLPQILVRLFPDLARLSPQSTVHAKTLYSAVNMVYRCPPGPIFAELVRQPCFISMGENYWRFNPSLWSGG